MAVGDVINGISAISTIINFQPAAGVECIITHISNYNAWVDITDGVLFAPVGNAGTTVPMLGNNFNTKISINNTNYLTIRASVTAVSSGYSGIQIK